MFCYVPLSDSKYYSDVSFASLQGKLNTASLANEFCIIGDLHARFGDFRDVPKLAELPNNSLYSYSSLPDTVRNPNDCSYNLSTICKESAMLILSNLKTENQHFFGDKTYCKGGQ